MSDEPVSTNSILQLQNLYTAMCAFVSNLPIPDAEKRDAMVSFRAGFLVAKEMILLYLSQNQDKVAAADDVITVADDVVEAVNSPAPAA